MMTLKPSSLLPLLMGKVQLAALQLPANSQLVYTDRHRAVLQCVGHTLEQQRQHFHGLRLEEVGRPFAFGQQLWDACRQWLRADNHDAEGIVNLVALEQFVTRLPEGTAEWVQCHHLALLDQAIELAEDHMVAIPMAGQHVSSSPLSSLSLPPSALRPCPIPPPRRQGPAPPQLAHCTHGALPFLASLSVSSPSQVSDVRNTSAEGEAGPVCWRCGEPEHLQHQCSAVEVGTVVWIPNAPGTAFDRAGVYRVLLHVGPGIEMLASSAPRTCLIHPGAVCLVGVLSHRSCGGWPHEDS
ncbi:zinc finger protein 213-like [Neoarius graeffei]|uniref:zinc finger protein 213-like n=1 Tax=Neoarius graeffei TaxID=443677 RepID=UPI00298CE902|nr:zinc finger protein 213-like [Neoarius graeffei]XP_060763479.1 zinc finger protein 213-like [Neoarius graeffei]XP_060763480.1 zinc finger protein 213-like [Neoarius graeffei]XP_060763481.1 zinc finger protein 213-like [Neoarius graeffei]